MVVVCLSVGRRLSRMYPGQRVGLRETHLYELLAMCLKSRHAQFQRSSARGTFSNSGLNERG